MMRNILCLLMFIAAASNLTAATWQVGAGVGKARWGKGFAEARSDPSVVISAGVSPTPYWLIDLEATQLQSEFRGFRPPDGEMRSRMYSLAAHRRLKIASAASILISLGASSISHDRRVAPSTAGLTGGLAGELDLRTNLVAVVRAKYHTWQESGSLIENPRLSFSVSLVYRF